MINYSIIIPHKNTPDLLQYCLDSIPVRDDVQVIVVDDNSEAEKVDFECFPQWKGENYEYYLTKEGKGAGYARNVALEHAQGKWVVFVDADDFLLPNVGDVFDEEKDTEADIVFFRPKAVMLEDRVTPSSRTDYFNAFVDAYLEDGDETLLRCRWLSPCCKLFRLEMIRDNHIRFDEIRYSNDALFSVMAGTKASKIIVRNKSYLCITESSNSLTSNFLKKPGELQIRADAFFRAQLVLKEEGYSITNENTAYRLLRLLLVVDKDAFVLNFKRMMALGYKKFRSINDLFKTNGFKARMKRTVYAYCILLFD
jgi:glycosyltransferase involved in cell wall biosynthesis